MLVLAGSRGQGSSQVTVKKKKEGQNGLFIYAPKQVSENQDDETHLNCLAFCCCLCALLVSELKLCPDFSSSCHLVSCFCLVWGFLTHHSSSKKKNSNTHTTESLTFFSYSKKSNSTVMPCVLVCAVHPFTAGCVFICRETSRKDWR